MSAVLVEYGSSDDEEDEVLQLSDSDEDIQAPVQPKPVQRPPAPPRPAAASCLPPPDALFRKVKGPPAFLKSAATEPIPGIPPPGGRHLGGGGAMPSAMAGSGGETAQHPPTEERRAPPPGAVMEAKAQLRTEWEEDGGAGPGPSKISHQADLARKKPGVGMPPPADAAQLLRTCEACNVPKIMSNARGGIMVCPLCHDRPAKDGDKEGEASKKKREGAVKDKEKAKRMKGQSSHATWKSETEMQLRQQFD